jgi:hypothetical protein
MEEEGSLPCIGFPDRPPKRMPDREINPLIIIR